MYTIKTRGEADRSKEGGVEATGRAGEGAREREGTKVGARESVGEGERNMKKVGRYMRMLNDRRVI